MKLTSILRTAVKVLCYTLLSALLLVVGAVMALYSPWMQHLLVDSLNHSRLGAMEIHMTDFRLRFPAHVRADSLVLVSAGDTLLQSRRVEASLQLWALMGGELRIDPATLLDSRMTVGSPDSATYMRITADTLSLHPASIALATMSIGLHDAEINGGRVAMTMRPDTAQKPSSPMPDMSIVVDRLRLRRFAFEMQMMPSIDSLGAYISDATLADAKILLREQHIDIKSLVGEGLNATYLTPPTSVPTEPTPTTEPADTAQPWVVAIDTIGFTHGRGLYAVSGYKPLPGLDFSYIEADIERLGVKDFYNRATEVRLPLSLLATERCGVTLDASGTVGVDATALTLNDFQVAFPGTSSSLDFNATMGMGDMTNDPSLPLSLHALGSVPLRALAQMFPASAPIVAAMHSDDAANLAADIDGTTGSLNIDRLELGLRHTMRLRASGYVANAFDFNNISGEVKLHGGIFDGASIRDLVMGRDTRLHIPPLTLDGNVDMHRGNIDGTLSGTTGAGHLALDASWLARAEGYKLDLQTDAFPVQAFVPDMDVRDLSLRLTADGHGLSPFAPKTAANVDLRLDGVEYQGVKYSDIDLNAVLAEGKATIDAVSLSPDAEFTLQASGNLDDAPYEWQLAFDSSDIDLRKLKFSPSALVFSANVNATAAYTPVKGRQIGLVTARVNLNSLDYTGDMGQFNLNSVTARLNAADSVTNLSLNNRDFYTFFSSDCSIDSLLSSFAATSALLNSQIEQRNIRVDTLRRALPPFVLDLYAGGDNALTDVLAARDMGFGHMQFQAANDSLLSLRGDVLGFHTASLTLDTITLNANQRGDNLVFGASVGNRPGTLDEWASVNLRGFLRTDHVGLRLSQRNIKGQTGYDIGLRAALADSTATLNFIPYNPIIGYKPWTVNPDNFVSYDFAEGHFDANLHMQGGNSTLAIYTEHEHDHDGDGVDDHEHHHGELEQEDIIVKISDLHLQDWIVLNPFAPPVKGDIGADLRLNYRDRIATGSGSVGIANFFYGRNRVGTFEADFDVSTDIKGSLKARADLYVDSLRAMTLRGDLTTRAKADSLSTEPIVVDVALTGFPLSVANPFLPTGTASLRGRLNGSLSATGKPLKPKLNGWLEFDSTAVRLAITGTDYAFSPTRIAMDDNIVKFNDFAISGVNDNPLYINGQADLRSLMNPTIDLQLRATDMQLVNTQRARRGVDVYGKAFVSLNATARGSLSLLNVSANLSLLPGTNVTYVMPEAVNAITDRSSGEMVKFVNFADTAAVAQADSLANKEMLLFVNAVVNLQEGSTVSVDLSADGKNKVQIQPSGTLNYSMTPVTPDGRLSGRIYINKGFARYTLPPLSEKLFNFEQGSYVAFNGDILNPTLNLHAYDQVRTNVTQQGQNSRLVDFDVLLNVTGTLEQMKVDFDLNTDNDLTVANELQSMSPDQRANQAMNLLLYNVYTGPNTSTVNSALGGNMLYSFLESQLNSLAAKSIHGVDLTFGINQYDRTYQGQTSLTTTYSYQVSKSLFDDRLKIVVGGNYSTDANVDENFSENLINDISFEYYLNRQHTMYLRLFRHTGFESIIEGEVTQTGVGFVYKRKLRRLIDLFRPFRRLDTQASAPQIDNAKQNLSSDK